MCRLISAFDGQLVSGFWGHCRGHVRFSRMYFWLYDYFTWCWQIGCCAVAVWRRVFFWCDFRCSVCRWLSFVLHRWRRCVLNHTSWCLIVFGIKVIIGTLFWFCNICDKEKWKIELRFTFFPNFAVVLFSYSSNYLVLTLVKGIREAEQAGQCVPFLSCWQT